MVHWSIVEKMGGENLSVLDLIASSSLNSLTSWCCCAGSFQNPMPRVVATCGDSEVAVVVRNDVDG